jgi:hypothetical protein
MYDLVLGRDVLDTISGYVVPVEQSFVYYPALQSLDFRKHTLPVVTGRKPIRNLAGSSAAALADVMAFVPACGAILQDDEVPVMPNTSATAATSGEPHISEPESDCHVLLRILMLVGWIMRLVISSPTRCISWCKRSCATIKHGLAAACTLLYATAAQQAPWHGTLYWRIGRDHRASDGTRIRLRCAEGHSGHKPRFVNIHRRTVTWQHVRHVWSARALILLILVGAALISGAAAGQIVQHAFTPVCARAHWAPLLLPMHYDPRHSLAAGVNADVGGTFRC